MPDVVMPRLVEHMEQGVIARWLHGDGEPIEAGDELVEIETDKATTVVESEHSGVLSIIAAEGETVDVGKPIAKVGESVAASAQSDPVAASGQSDPSATSAQSEAAPAATALSANGQGRRTRHLASPVARRIAREHGVELAQVSGSGPGGRVLRADVLRAIEGDGELGTRTPASGNGAHAAGSVTQGPGDAQSALPAAEAQPSLHPRAGAESAVSRELSAVQRTIARRMAEANNAVPDFAVEVEVDMTACLQLRDQLRAEAGPEEPVPSINDLVVKACGRALRAFPLANGSYRDDRFEAHEQVNIGVAVAGEASLIVPTVFDADRLSLAEIARETRRLAMRVREGAISPAELAGGTFTVSNLGMFGVSRFTAIVNQPQACILAVGSVLERPAILDGEVLPRPIMTMTLASDHRIIYGADAARFLGIVRQNLERPLSMAL